MVNEVKIPFYCHKGRHSIYLPKELVLDSTFPFSPGDEIIAKIKTINGKKVLILKKKGD